MRAELDWIATTLINDEASSDEEMTDHFAREGNMSRKEAEYYVSQRSEALKHPLTFRVRAFESELPAIIRCPNHHGGGVTYCPRGGAALQIWQRQQWGEG